MKCRNCNKDEKEVQRFIRKAQLCISCYNLRRYYLLYQKLEKPYKTHPYSYHKEYLEKNPKRKRELHISQQTHHKYGKAEICSNCGLTDDVHHHHFKPYHVDKFVDLCRVCHDELHRREMPEKLMMTLTNKQKLGIK